MARASCAIPTGTEMIAWRPIWHVVACSAVVSLLSLACRAADVAADEFVLSDTCPASFRRAADGLCALDTLYGDYESALGQGGLRVALPPIRSGFTARQIDLGRYLFFDPILSRDGNLSCAHCHHPEYGFSDGRGTSSGRGGRGVGPNRQGGAAQRRNVPSLWNVGFRQRLLWDGSAHSAEEQVAGPLFSSSEMANTPARLIGRLNSNAVYRRLFASAFRTPAATDINLSTVATAIAAFEATLVSINSRYDWYVHGNEDALSNEERRGLETFLSGLAGCSQCHTPPLFTNGQFAVIGVPEPAGHEFDIGQQGLSGRPQDRGAFIVPSLRNVSLTAPYMHSGVFHSLPDVIRFYNAGRGASVPRGQNLSVHWILPEDPRLTVAEQSNLLAFLRALEDTSLAPKVPTAVPSGLKVVSTRDHLLELR